MVPGSWVLKYNTFSFTLTPFLYPVLSGTENMGHLTGLKKGGSGTAPEPPLIV